MSLTRTGLATAADAGAAPASTPAVTASHTAAATVVHRSPRNPHRTRRDEHHISMRILAQRPPVRITERG
jgi:hypothetical protein